MQHQNLQMLVYTRVLLKYIFYTIVDKQTVTLNLVRLCTHVYTAAHMGMRIRARIRGNMSNRFKLFDK